MLTARNRLAEGLVLIKPKGITGRETKRQRLVFKTPKRKQVKVCLGPRAAWQILVYEDVGQGVT